MYGAAEIGIVAERLSELDQITIDFSGLDERQLILLASVAPTEWLPAMRVVDNRYKLLESKPDVSEVTTYTFEEMGREDLNLRVELLLRSGLEVDAILKLFSLEN